MVISNDTKVSTIKILQKLVLSYNLGINLMVIKIAIKCNAYIP
jgi:hypothetical protein